MRVGYVRCSTAEQNEARQLKMMEDQKVEKIFIDKASGKNVDRKDFKAMMAFVRAGDTVIVESISRIARNTRDLLTIISSLTEKGVEFVSLKENIDTTTPHGRFMLTVFGALAELERESILERQREGIEIAKAEGMSISQLAIAFMRDCGGTTSLVLGADTPEQVRSNVAYFDTPKLSDLTMRVLYKEFEDVDIPAIMQVLSRPKK